MKKQEYIFTFGSESELANYYISIYDTYEEARNRMVKIFESRWAFQYKNKNEAGVDKYNLKPLIKL